MEGGPANNYEQERAGLRSRETDRISILKGKGYVERGKLIKMIDHSGFVPYEPAVPAYGMNTDDQQVGEKMRGGETYTSNKRDWKK